MNGIMEDVKIMEEGGSDPHSLILSVEVGSIRTDDRGSSFGTMNSFRYKLMVENDAHEKRVTGTARWIGGLSAHTRDDVDAEGSADQAMRVSLDAVRRYLGEKFPGTRIVGVVRCEACSYYHNSRDVHLE